MPYNECFYDNMYNFKFVLPIDIDEIIFPLTFDNWNDLMAYVFETDPKAETTVGSFAVRHAHFFKRNSSDIPEGTLVTVDTIERSANVSKPGIRVKSFVNTQVKRPLELLIKLCGTLSEPYLGKGFKGCSLGPSMMYLFIFLT